jgi:hypothetical protein
MAVADAVRAHKVSALVVDPVLVATCGDSLAGSEVAHLCVCVCVCRQSWQWQMLSGLTRCPP